MPDRVPSLERISEALIRSGLQSKIDPDKVIVVAGTNGKGTVAKSLETMLLASGECVGLYTSPHMESTTERIRLNGQNISETEFVQVFNDVARKLRGLELSHFEMLTAMAVEYFYEKDPQTLRQTKVTWSIFEVGMGGTWDATNAIPHNNAVITSLGLDHAKFLGNDLVSIAGNKFGVVGSNANVFYQPSDDSGVNNLRLSVAERTNSKWTPAEILDYRVSFHDSWPEWEICLNEKWYPLSMQGRRAVENISLAYTAFRGLGFALNDEIASAMSSMVWPCRMQKISWLGADQSPVFFSGDHNEQGIQSLVEILQHYTSVKKIKVLLGVGENKSVEDFWLQFNRANLPIEIHLTESPFRGMKIETYGDVGRYAASIVKCPVEALCAVESTLEPNEMLVVTGSLYLVGHLSAERDKITRLKGKIVCRNPQLVESSIGLDRTRID